MAIVIGGVLPQRPKIFNRGMHLMVAAIVMSIPLEAHPIMFKQVGRSIWTHWKYSLAMSNDPMTPPPGLNIIDTIRERSDYLIIGSDASTHLTSGILTCAWMITTNDQHIQGYCNIMNISSREFTDHSYMLFKDD
jgi:hypothetical protein